jgi:hypothetical protein
MRTPHARPSSPLAIPPVPAGINTYYETEFRAVWNERELRTEQHEFIYEVSWIPEMGVWRRFLRTRRKA